MGRRGGLVFVLLLGLLSYGPLRGSKRARGLGRDRGSDAEDVGSISSLASFSAAKSKRERQRKGGMGWIEHQCLGRGRSRTE